MHTLDIYIYDEVPQSTIGLYKGTQKLNPYYFNAWSLRIHFSSTFGPISVSHIVHTVHIYDDIIII